MPITHRIPARFHVYYSLLGRSMRRQIDDPLRAESLFIAALVLLGTGLILVHFLISAAVGPPSAAAPDWVWIGEAGLFLSFVLTCVAGIQPEITITRAEDRLEIRQAARCCTLPYAAIDEVERISDETFYRHYRRYENTTSFVNRLPPTVLLLQTRGGPIVLGLPVPAQEELRAALHSSSFAHSSAASPAP